VWCDVPTSSKIRLRFIQCSGALREPVRKLKYRDTGPFLKDINFALQSHYSHGRATTPWTAAPTSVMHPFWHVSKPLALSASTNFNTLIGLLSPFWYYRLVHHSFEPDAGDFLLLSQLLIWCKSAETYRSGSSFPYADLSQSQPCWVCVIFCA